MVVVVLEGGGLIVELIQNDNALKGSGVSREQSVLLPMQI